MKKKKKNSEKPWENLSYYHATKRKLLNTSFYVADKFFSFLIF